MHEEGFTMLLEALFKQYRADVTDAVESAEPLRTELLERLKLESQKGLIGTIMELLDLTYEGIVTSVKKDLNYECEDIPDAD